MFEDYAKKQRRDREDFNRNLKHGRALSDLGQKHRMDNHFVLDRRRQEDSYTSPIISPSRSGPLEFIEKHNLANQRTQEDLGRSFRQASELDSLKRSQQWENDRVRDKRRKEDRGNWFNKLT
jgi:hypothetical protein